ncbi:hypothetical protein F5I97DRAFT_1829713 [Phlebopus sp. FC_14]|nr:hypothetical protein F5I97DRAFT_1829713 [Phlebopus sp. FC_14]
MDYSLKSARRTCLAFSYSYSSRSTPNVGFFFHEGRDKHGKPSNSRSSNDDVKKQWGDIDLRNSGHVHYSPPISVDVEDEHGGRKAFKYPDNRQLSINGIVTRELLADPDLYDSEGEPHHIVLKDGNTTGLTVGRYAGLESFLCDEDGIESIELGIYNYYHKKAGVFSVKGDSVSLIVDGLGRMLGLLYSGTSKAARPDPTSWLISHIGAKCLHLDLNRVAWCFDRWAAVKALASLHTSFVPSTSSQFSTLAIYRLVVSNDGESLPWSWMRGLVV